MKFITILDNFLTFVVLIKIAFLLTAIGNDITSKTNNKDLQRLAPAMKYFKERLEFVFTVSMAILLIIYFIPGSNLQVFGKSRVLFFAFGIVLLFTAKWKMFITEAPWFKLLVNTLGLD